MRRRRSVSPACMGSGCIAARPLPVAGNTRSSCNHRTPRREVTSSPPNQKWTRNGNPFSLLYRFYYILLNDCFVKSKNLLYAIYAGDYESGLHRIFSFRDITGVWRTNWILFNAATTDSIQWFNFYYFANVVLDYCNANRGLKFFIITGTFVVIIYKETYHIDVDSLELRYQCRVFIKIWK